MIGGDAGRYGMFREWALGVKNRGGALAGEAAVVANTNVVAAYLLGAERLFDEVPVIDIGDVGVESTSSSAIGGGEESIASVTVSVTVRDGDDVVSCSAERVKDMFEATSDLADWNGGAKLTPEVTVLGNDGGIMRFKVVPGDGSATKAFLRVKVK